MYVSSFQNRLNAVLSPRHMKQFVPYFEEREEQKTMAKAVLDAFIHNAVSLIEAGTGTGKSLGYLLPALLWSNETGERIVISTHTIALQEQLLTKEIPAALAMLEIDLPVSIAKGMANYLCEMKLYEATKQANLFQDERMKSLTAIFDWSRNEQEIITKSRLPFKISSSEWKDINVDPETCVSARCPFFSSCHFFRSRKALSDSKIIIVNHHLLLSDLQRRVETNNWEGPSILPPYKRIIIDEAHHLEDVALDLFSAKVHRFEHLHLIRQFSKESSSESVEGNTAALMKLVQAIHQDAVFFTADWKLKVLHYFDLDLAVAAKALIKSSEVLFESIYVYAKSEMRVENRGEEKSGGRLREANRLRIRDKDVEKASFSRAKEKAEEHERAFRSFDASWNGFLSLLKEGGIAAGGPSHEELKYNGKSSGFLDLLKGLISDLKNNKERIERQMANLRLFFEAIADKEKVTWVEWKESHIGAIDISFVVSSFDVGPLLRKNLFDPMATSILLSATLATKESFEFTKHRLGLSLFERETQGKIMESIYPSPFPYDKNALLSVVEDMPQPSEKEHNRILEEVILSIAKASRGGVLILFTSYGALEAVFPSLSPQLSSMGLRPMKQGDMPRTKLLQEFRASHSSVLCATDSFWEGVDIPGDALRCVVITKLPFEVPTDPLFEARSEAMTQKGLSPFYHYALPKAVVKFKQAFGRLIRRSSDYGVVVSLDSRLTKKGYGLHFIQSIPQCAVWKGSYKDVGAQVERKLASHKLL